MIGLILAAGNNTRISEHITFPNKVLIPIGGRTLILRNMDHIADTVDKFVIVVGKAEDHIRKEISESEYADRVTYVKQNVATGTLDAMRLALPYIDDDVFLVLGDEFIINGRTIDMVADFREKDAGASVGIIPDSDEFFIKEAYTVRYDGGCVTEFIEKPKVTFNKDRGTGYYVIKKEVFLSLVDIDPGMKEIIDLFNFAIRNGHKVVSFDIADEEYNINTKQQLDRANESFRRNQ